jgi:hypothetical protein
LISEGHYSTAIAVFDREDANWVLGWIKATIKRIEDSPESDAEVLPRTRTRLGCWRYG